jgi:hypothetical protein
MYTKNKSGHTGSTIYLFFSKLAVEQSNLGLGITMECFKNSSLFVSRVLYQQGSQVILGAGRRVQLS